MNELQKVFKYSDIEVRTVIKDGEPWFVAGDVCKILEISNTTQAVERLDVDEVTMFNIGGLSGEVNIINEPGLYSLIFSSRKEEAKQFKRWVTHEVLPSIRKTGKYEAPNFLAEMHNSMGKIRALSWHATPTVRKQHVNENLAKIREYYHGLIDRDAKNEPNPISIFMQECCVINENAIIERTPLYNSYVLWCYKNDIYPKSKLKLTAYLGELDEVAYLSPDSKNCLNARFMGIELNNEGLRTIGG